MNETPNSKDRGATSSIQKDSSPRRSLAILVAAASMCLMASCGGEGGDTSLNGNRQGAVGEEAGSNASQNSNQQGQGMQNNDDGAFKSHLPADLPIGDRLKHDTKAMYLRENGSYLPVYEGYEMVVGKRVSNPKEYEKIGGRLWWNFADLMGAPGTPPVTVLYKYINGRSMIPGTGPARGVEWLYGLKFTNLAMGLDFRPEKMSVGGETGMPEGFTEMALGRSIQKSEAEALFAKGGKLMYEGRAFALPHGDVIENPLKQGSFTYTLDLNSKTGHGEIRGLGDIPLKIWKDGRHVDADKESLKGVDRIILGESKLEDGRCQPLWSEKPGLNEATVKFKNGSDLKASYGVVFLGPQADEVAGKVFLDGDKIGVVFLGDKAAR